jgi:hypothetical protein
MVLWKLNILNVNGVVSKQPGIMQQLIEKVRLEKLMLKL